MTFDENSMLKISNFYQHNTTSKNPLTYPFSSDRKSFDMPQNPLHTQKTQKEGKIRR